MLFFNLELLENKAKTDKDLYSALHNLYLKKEIKRTRLDKSLIIPNLRLGNSFILNPTDLFTKVNNIVYASQYIKLAGRRSYLMYSNFGIRYLDLSFYPDLNLEVVKFNYLLKISNNKIHFKFEE